MERLSVQLVRTFERLLSEAGTVGTAPLVEQLLDCTGTETERDRLHWY